MSYAIFPNCGSVSDSCFQALSNLTNISFPECRFVQTNAFYGCYNLPLISFPKILSLTYSPFMNCSAISKAYFLGPMIPAVQNGSSNFFANTPMSSTSYLGYYGSIYVRASLASLYKITSGWSWYSDRIVGIEVYDVSKNITHGQCLIDDYLGEGTSTFGTIYPDDGYALPSSITVSGCDYTYDNTTGKVTISNPTGDVTITGECNPS